MKKALRLVLVVVVLAIGLGIFYLSHDPIDARADRSFDVTVSAAAFTDRHPVMLFDEGHNGPHRMRGRYAPFVALMRNDGYDVRGHKGEFTAKSLQGADVLVIVNAAGGTNPQIFGFNLPFLRKGERSAPAFTVAEVEAVAAWVREGGSLLLVADHYPFGSASKDLASAFGVHMHCGFAEVSDPYPVEIDKGAIGFSRKNGTLVDGPIANGRTPTERVDLVVTFTGQSLDAPDAHIVLQLPETAIEYVPPPPNFTEQQAGAAQGLALEHGKGRVVVLGEAGMLSAQVEKDLPFGMNVPGVGNKQFALNTVHWLSRLL